MNYRYILSSVFTVALLASCSDEDSAIGIQPEAGTYSLSGKVEKGPFVRGSAISVQPLNTSLNSIGTAFNSEIIDNAGTFNLGEIELASQFVRITTDGYYFNEVTGNLSTGTLHLVALADISDRNSVNVNILTHLKSARIQKLMQEGATFASADRQAQKELLTQFGLQAYENTPAESMSIAAGTDGSGVLIAISSIILSDRSDAEITQYLSALSQDLADDGTFSEANMKTIFQGKNRVTKDLDKLAQNIKDRYAELGMNVSIPDLRYFYDWNNDGIAGNEIIDNVQVTLSQDNVTFEKDGGTTTITVASNTPLSLEKFKDPYGDGYIGLTPPNISIPAQYDFFVEQGNPIKCDYTFENNILSIKVAKTERHSKQTTTIPLYDMMGICQATIKVSLEGDPSIELKLGDTGKKIVLGSLSYFAAAISWMLYAEYGYTGMYEFHDVKCPLNPYNQYNSRAFSSAYASISMNENIIRVLESLDYSETTSFFKLLNTIIYTEMIEKWGRIGILETAQPEWMQPVVQQPSEYNLRYLNSLLDSIESLFAERKSDSQFISSESTINISKDVWRMAKANVCVALGEYSQAKIILQQIVDSHHYSITSGNENDPNDGTILHLVVPDEVMQGEHSIGYYTYADVLLMLAECHLATGNDNDAAPLIKQVANAKSISISSNNIDNIAQLRKQLLMPRYFAFQKRNNRGEYEMYQRVWPIPNDEILRSSTWTQNQGY